MADEDFLDYIVPLYGVNPIHRLESEKEHPSRPVRARTLRGTITAVNRATARRNPSQQLDITVGGQDVTELVIRVDSGEIADLAGKQVVIFLQD